MIVKYKNLLWMGSINAVIMPFLFVTSFWLDNMFNTRPVITIVITLLCLMGIILGLGGSYLWVKRKNRHWIFSCYGLFAPIGLLGIALLRENNPKRNSNG